MNEKHQKVHPACVIFPMNKGRSFAELKADIYEHGQQVPCVFDGDVLLDGRCRLKICRELKRDPTTVQFNTLGVNITPAQWIMSVNLHRRSLSDTQRLAIVAEFERLEAKRLKEESEAAKAAVAKGVPVRKRTGTPRKPGRPSTGGRTREKVAKASGSSQHRANQMLRLRAANPKLAVEVEEGRMTLLEAYKMAGLHKSSRQKEKPAAAEPETAKPAAVDTSERKPDGNLTDAAFKARLNNLWNLIQTTCKNCTPSDLQRICLHTALYLDVSLSQRVTSERNLDDMPREQFESLIALVRTLKSVIVSDFSVDERASHWLAALWSVHAQQRPELFAKVSELVAAWGDELSKAKTNIPNKPT